VAEPVVYKIVRVGFFCFVFGWVFRKSTPTTHRFRAQDSTTTATANPNRAPLTEDGGSDGEDDVLP
jgi:hypothetical protein